MANFDFIIKKPDSVADIEYVYQASRGLKGNDVYYIDNTQYYIIENITTDIDTIKSYLTYDLKNAANVENLILRTPEEEIYGKFDDGSRVRIYGHPTYYNYLDYIQGDSSYSANWKDTLKILHDFKWVQNC